MGGLVRERKCSLVASANYCGLVASVCLCVDECFLEFVFFSIGDATLGEKGTRSREREATRREQKMTAAACISAADCPAPAACSVPAHGRF